MYAAYFGLTEPPFSIAPDPRYLYMSARHREAMAHLLYGIEQGGGFVQLTGEVGTGKTTLCRLLLSNLPDNVEVALILNPRIDELELLRAIGKELRIDCSQAARGQDLLGLLNQHLLAVHADGRRTVLIVDESQNLTHEVLEQIRLLTNLETTKQKLLQIILIGQPELVEVLARPNLRQLSQRITARYHLLPLSKAETAAYIAFRLSVAGRTESLFSDGAIRQVFRLSKGVPRLINIICDRALLGAYGQDSRSVGRAMVKRAAREVQGTASGSHRFSGWARWVTVLAVVALVAALVVLRDDVMDNVNRSVEKRLAKGPDGSAAPAAGAGSGDPAAPLAEPQASVSLSDPNAGESLLFDLALKLDIPAAPTRAGRSVVEDVSLETVLAESASGYRDAVKRLVELWGAQPDLVDDCATVDRVGLQCLARSADWASLSELNRPAILTLTGEFGATPRYLVVTALRGDRIEADIAGNKYLFTRAAIDRYWNGRFTLLWRPPPRQVGSADVELEWLHEAMSQWSLRAGGEALALPDTVADEALLRDHLKAFQRQHRLAATGDLRADTIIHLNSVLNGGDIPVLAN